VYREEADLGTGTPNGQLRILGCPWLSRHMKKVSDVPEKLAMCVLKNINPLKTKRICFI
jgi:hypothetical protein